MENANSRLMMTCEYLETPVGIMNPRPRFSWRVQGELQNTSQTSYRGRGRYGFVEQHSTAYYSAAWIHGFGGSIIDADGTPFPDQQAVKDALEYHLKFVDLMPGETEYSTVNTLFLEGKADATIGGPWMVPSAREANIDLGIASMPTVDKTGRALAPYSADFG